MRNNIFYEWKVEQWIDEDIEDFEHFDKLADALKEEPIKGATIKICLVRDEGNEDEGLLDREHAYIKDSMLQNYESPDGDPYTEYSPPVKYQKEVERAFR